MIGNFEQLLSRALEIPRKRVLVMYPNNTETMSAVLQAEAMSLARFMLVGDDGMIRRLISDLGGRGDNFEIINQPSVHAALQESIALVQDGKADILMKGGVDTSTIMKAVLREDSGVRTGRLLSDIFILEFPQRTVNKFIMITDGGMTLLPDLKNKVELINNAVEVAHALGNPNPKVAVLSATEFVMPNLQSTLDAAALAKMNERGQIKGCIVDGPFALDNAIHRAPTKAMRSCSPLPSA